MPFFLRTSRQRHLQYRAIGFGQRVLRFIAHSKASGVDDHGWRTSREVIDKELRGGFIFQAGNEDRRCVEALQFREGIL